MKKTGAATDSLLLACAKFTTIAIGIACTMILSRSLSLNAYGTYSQANLIATLGTTLTVLGLADAVNFFFNQTGSSKDNEESVNTIFAVQVIIGLCAALAIIVFAGLFSDYFHNAELAALMIYVAFRPLAGNLVTSMQVLMVSISKARTLAIRNVIVSLIKLCAILYTSLVYQDIRIILITLLLIDVVTVAWFLATVKKHGYRVNPRKANFGRLAAILSFCLPMAVYILCLSASKEVGKLVIGRFMDTDWYAIYSNCSTPLPFDVLSASFLVVLIPVLTRQIAGKDFESARSLFRQYLSIGCITTISLSISCLVVSPELVSLLYGEKYLPGAVVFAITMLTGMTQFANMSLVLSAGGKTRILMVVSAVSLFVTIALSLGLFFAFGFVGPAIATLFGSILNTGLLMHFSANSIGARVSEVFPVGPLLLYFAKCLPIGLVALLLKHCLLGVGCSDAICGLLVAATCAAVLLALNKRQLMDPIKQINKL